MSLIALAQQLRRPRTLTRSLLILVAVTGGIIVGLLAMHSLNTHTAAPTPTSATNVIGHADGAAHTHPGDTAAVGDTGCVDCGEHHEMLVMGCVLALLVTVLLLTRPARWWLVATLPARAGPAVLLVSPHPIARPPSLNVLCISRT